MRSAHRVWLLRLAAGIALGAAAVLALSCGRGGRESRPRLVAVAILDTTRFDHLPIYGHPRNTTPTVAALASDARIYDRALATAPWTVPSHASIFTGLLPSALDVGWHQTHLPDGVPVIAAHFGRSGYWTIGVSENPLLTTETGFARGFDRWSNVLPGNALGSLAAALREREGQQPVFLFVNLIAPHLPYDPPPTARAEFLPNPVPRAIFLSHQGWTNLLALRLSGSLSDEDLDLLRDLYDGEIRSADGELRDLLALLREAGFGDDSVIAVAADHGENIGDHGLFDHQLCAYNTLLHVPLLIRAPGRIAAGRVAAPVSLKDLWRTLAEIADLPEREAVPGRSLLAPARSEPVLSQYERPQPILESLARCCPSMDAAHFDRVLVAAQEERFKLIFSSNGDHEFYDLTRDPGETRNLYAAPPDAEAAAALRRLLPIARASAAESDRKRAAPLSEDERERLRALGYLNDGR